VISNRRLADLEGPDFYPTPAWGTRALLRHIAFDGPILEPCCGDGAMAEILKESGQPVFASDIVDRGYGAVCDFLDITQAQSNIVTNPPFNIAEILLAHALGLAEQKVCFLLRTAFLESRRRYKAFYRNNPPELVLIFVERLSMYPKGQEIDGGGTTSYAWFVWNNAIEVAAPTIEWIAPGRKLVAEGQLELITNDLNVNK